jgi:hypothetical protein
MPFAASFDDAYELAIKPACDAAGAYAERIDEQIFQENILQRMYNQVARADLVIADLSGRNANVFYEAGYAHACRKQVIFLAHDAAEVPFDVRAYPPVFYGADLVYLRQELEQKVRRVLEARGSGPSPLALPVDVTVNGCVLSPAVTQEIPVHIRDYQEFGWVLASLIVQNPVVRIIRPIDIRIGVITPPAYNVNMAGKTKVEWEDTRDGMRLHLLRADYRLLPGTWEKYGLRIYLTKKHEVSEVIGPFTIRILTVDGYFDFPFRLRITPAPTAEGESA